MAEADTFPCAVGAFALRPLYTRALGLSDFPCTTKSGGGSIEKSGSGRPVLWRRPTPEKRGPVSRAPYSCWARRTDHDSPLLIKVLSRAKAEWRCTGRQNGGRIRRPRERRSAGTRWRRAGSKVGGTEAGRDADQVRAESTMHAGESSICEWCRDDFVDADSSRIWGGFCWRLSRIAILLRMYDYGRLGVHIEKCCERTKL